MALVAAVQVESDHTGNNHHDRDDFLYGHILSKVDGARSMVVVRR